MQLHVKSQKRYLGIIDIVFLSISLFMLIGLINKGLTESTCNITLFLLGSIIGYRILKSGYLYTFTLFYFHLIIAFIVEVVYLNLDYCVLESKYNNNVLTDNNLLIARSLLIMTFLIVYLCCILFCKVETSRNNNLAKSLLDNLSFSVHADKLHLAYYFTVLLTLLLDGLLITNTTVLQVAYPFNHLTHWVPHIAIKIPLSISCVPLLICYIFTGLGHTNYLGKLQLSRVLVLISGIIYILVRGGRGYATFIFLLVALLEFSKSLGFKRSYFWCGVYLFMVYFCYDIWVSLRSTLAYLSVDRAINLAIHSSMITFIPELININNYSFKISSFTMLGQSIFHLLYVIQLLQDGISLAGDTFTNLIYQILPSQFDGVFGLERPLNDNYKLAYHYSHGGGFLSIANAYWNGGAWVVMAFVLFLAITFIYFDRKAYDENSGFLYKYIYLLSFSPMLIQLAYGIQGLIRIVEILFLLILFEKISSGKEKNKSCHYA